MTTFHAVVRIDHHSAEILQFDAEHVQAQKVKAHAHHTARHANGVRTEQEFFAEVCDALTGIPEVLVAGSRTAMADFRNHLERHRPALAKHILGYEVVDHPTTPQLVALARDIFLKLDRMAGTPSSP